MKILYMIPLVFLSCNPETELKSDEAMRILKAELGYPKPLEIRVNLVGEQMRDRVKNAGLVDSGVVQTKEITRMTALGSAVISFTGKGQKYVLGTPEEDPSGKVLMVKAADINISEINTISMTDDKKASVQYTVTFKNMTPFRVLVTKDLTRPEIRHADFVKTDRWELVKH